MTLALALSLLTLGVCVALILRARRSQHRLAEELRAERLRAQCVDQLLDVWQWQSDA